MDRPTPPASFAESSDLSSFGTRLIPAPEVWEWLAQRRGGFVLVRALCQCETVLDLADRALEFLFVDLLCGHRGSSPAGVIRRSGVFVSARNGLKDA